ncbi:MAG: hypothetical protein ACOCQB_03440 [Halanaerobiaceae bacterium]
MRTGDEQILEIIQPVDVFGEVLLFGISENPANTFICSEVLFSEQRFSYRFGLVVLLLTGLLLAVRFILIRIKRGNYIVKLFVLVL